MKKLVIALGGNALQEAGKPATAQAQLEVVEKTSEYIADIVERGYEVIVAHGNGPQVGRIVIQNEVASASTPAMPFDVCGAMSQGMIGYHIQQGLSKVLRHRGINKNVVTVVTQVVVDKDDPKFKAPSKPIGPFYTEEEAKAIAAEKGYTMKEDAGEVDAPLARSKTDRKKMAIDPEGRTAVTRWRVLARGKDATLLDVRILTGRTHQIRVHMQSLHHPIAGDPIYGVRHGVHVGRLMLHAYSLSFTHPRTGERMTFTAKLPEDFVRGLRSVGLPASDS